jgi:hypothetical protein
MTLVKPGLKPVSGLFGRNRLPLFLGEFGAIRQSLVCIGAAAVHEMAPRRCAACNPSMLAAGMTCWMCFVARVSTMSARVAPPRPPECPPPRAYTDVEEKTKAITTISANARILDISRRFD